jgi:hypothetical protein
MPTLSQPQFLINGVIDTEKPVMQNMQTIASAAGAWVTYDTNAGKWSVIINREVQAGYFSQRTAKTITANGNAAVSTAQKKFGAGSVVFDGTGDDLVVASNADFAFGNGDFTVECWVYRSNASRVEWIAHWGTIGANYAGALYASGANLIYATSGTTRITGSNVLPTANTWYHVAVSRSSGVTRLFVNGTQRGSSYTDANTYAQGLVKIGSYSNANYFLGYIDEIRLSNSARYTGAFTSSSTAFENDANTVLLVHANTDITDDTLTYQTGIAKIYDDSNIIGNITISGTGITELYNKVQLQFPHKDIEDQTDYITWSIPTEDRFTNEQDQTLNIEFDCINDPVQAELLALRELKQSRVDKIIQFTTDYTSLGIKAGDLIEVTNTALGFVSKVFRIVSIQEDDIQDGNLIFSITALEYDANVYSTADLTRFTRSISNGIVSKGANTTITALDNQASLKVNTSPAAASQGLGMLFNANAGLWVLNQAGKLLTMPSYGGSNLGAVISWTFDTGQDLDIRCRVYQPNLGQNSINQYLGYTGGAGDVTQWPPTGTAIITWGGDNTGTGEETVLVNIGAFKAAYPTQPYLIVECRGNWFDTPGETPVLLSAAIYQGGTFSPSGFGFTNTGFSAKRVVTGLEIYVNVNDTDTAGQNVGELMGYFVYDIANNTAQFTNDVSYL